MLLQVAYGMLCYRLDLHYFMQSSRLDDSTYEQLPGLVPCRAVFLTESTMVMNLSQKVWCPARFLFHGCLNSY